MYIGIDAARQSQARLQPAQDATVEAKPKVREAKPLYNPPRRDRPRVVIVDRQVPHYRAALYTILMQSTRASYHIVAEAPPDSPSIDQFPRDWPWTNAPIHTIPGTGGRSVWQWGAVKTGCSRRFDTVLMMANPRDPGLWLCAIAARMTGKRVLMWTHGPKSAAAARQLFRRLWHRLATTLLFYGHRGRTLSVQAGNPPGKCHVVYNSLDYDRQRELRGAMTPARIAAVRDELFGRHDVPVIICICTLYAEKRVDVLLRAVPVLRQRGLEPRLLIVGEGQMRRQLERLSEELDIAPSIRFYGKCYSEPRTAQLMCSADLCVIPSAVGLAAMHSLAYGVPIITDGDLDTQSPEVEAIVPGRTGDLCPPNPEDLAAAIGAWLDAHPTRDDVADECIRMVERFYRPQIQAAAIERAVAGEPPVDMSVRDEEELIRS
jgi:glycosyltransferase involved in cell wall biosynthesis